MILVDCHPQVTAAVNAAIDCGGSFELEIILARMVVEAVPSVIMVRIVSSGTDHERHPPAPRFYRERHK
jgi:glutamate-1-semialdehyde 2,1-aminomutase